MNALRVSYKELDEKFDLTNQELTVKTGKLEKLTEVNLTVVCLYIAISFVVRYLFEILVTMKCRD